MIAGAAMAMSSVSVVTNSLRLRKKKLSIDSIADIRTGNFRRARVGFHLYQYLYNRRNDVRPLPRTGRKSAERH